MVGCSLGVTNQILGAKCYISQEGDQLKIFKFNPILESKTAGEKPELLLSLIFRGCILKVKDIAVFLLVSSML